MTWCDELEFGFGWTEPGFLERTSHALRIDGSVWLVDPLDAEGVHERVCALGKPAGVVQLLDRHARSSAAFANRHGVPLHVVPFGGVEDAPFEVLRVLERRRWREVALWWPAEGMLHFADALGTARYFCAPGERLGVHPLLRLTPPSSLRDMTRRLAPRHILSGHGAGIHGDEAALAFVEALATARSRIPRYLTGLVRGRR